MSTPTPHVMTPDEEAIMERALAKSTRIMSDAPTPLVDAATQDRGVFDYVTGEWKPDKVVPADFARRLETELRDARAELETERLRLAGCGVAAMANTPETVAQRIAPDSPYWSASYGDVCAAVDREMQLRAELDKAKAREDALREYWFSDADPRETEFAAAYLARIAVVP